MLKTITAITLLLAGLIAAPFAAAAQVELAYIAQMGEMVPVAAVPGDTIDGTIDTWAITADEAAIYLLEQYPITIYPTLQGPCRKR